MIPKPLRKVGADSLGGSKGSTPHKPPRKAVIYVDIWAISAGRGYWAYDNTGEKFYFKNSGEAREWAKKRGFDGIQMTTQEDGRS